MLAHLQQQHRSTKQVSQSREKQVFAGIRGGTDGIDGHLTGDELYRSGLFPTRHEDLEQIMVYLSIYLSIYSRSSTVDPRLPLGVIVQDLSVHGIGQTQETRAIKVMQTIRLSPGNMS